MRLEHLLTELFVAAGLDSVQFESVRVGVDVMVLGEQVGQRVEGCNDGEHHANNNLLIGGLVLTEVGDVLRDVVSHLRGRRRSAIIVLNHTVVELRGHSDDHVIVVWVEVATLRHVESEGGLVVVAGEQVVGVVDATRLMSARFGQLGRPHAHVGVLGLMNGHIGWPDSIMDLSLTEVPLLEEVSAVLLMSWMDLRQVDHLFLELHLGETLIDEKIVLLMHGSVATLAGTREDLETASQPVIYNGQS